MLLGTLDQKNDSYDAKRWEHLDALAKGGKAFHKHIRKFLPANPVEPGDVYETRIAQAHYRSYMGSIINLYASWVFVPGVSVKPSHRETNKPVETPAYYGRFQEDVGNETQLSAFMKERFRAALTTCMSYWLIELPSNDGSPPNTAQEYDERGLGEAWLKPIDQSEVWDWEENDKGELVWATVHTEVQPRMDWNMPRDLVVETWRIYTATDCHSFELRYSKKDGRPSDPNMQVTSNGSTPHGMKRVPLVRMCIPKELTVGEQVYDTQLEHFREDNALSWLIRRTCYAQPVFKLADPEGRPPTMGAGYAIVVGEDDDVGWTSPTSTPFDILQKAVDTKRDEIYRIVHQMAQGLDNNADTVGRSADSKEADEAATRIILAAFGELVSKPIEETLEIISEARGETDLEWSVEGFSGYDTATVANLLGNAAIARSLGIPSKTFTQELCTKAALALLPEADQRVKDTIRAEIKSAEFEVSSQPSEGLVNTANAKLASARADAEPVKAAAAMKGASRPTPSKSS